MRAFGAEEVQLVLLPLPLLLDFLGSFVPRQFLEQHLHYNVEDLEDVAQVALFEEVDVVNDVLEDHVLVLVYHFYHAEQAFLGVVYLRRLLLGLLLRFLQLPLQLFY